MVLYFYPKDETPGCTTEACEFRDNIFAFRELNAQVLGVSLDDVESHKAFADNHELPFPLLADIDGDTSSAYGVKTRMFGMTVAKRQTFIIGPDGNTGDLADLQETETNIDLGDVSCVKATSLTPHTVGWEDSATPAPGEVAFYLVEYFDGWSTSYGTASADKPRSPSSGACE